MHSPASKDSNLCTRATEGGMKNGCNWVHEQWNRYFVSVQSGLLKTKNTRAVPKFVLTSKSR